MKSSSLLKEPKDIYLLLVFAANAILYVSFIAFYESLSTTTASALGCLLVLLICTNYQCVAHNFIHNPFFKDNYHNTIFSLLNSPLLGIPQCLYKVHHLNHHRYNNDKVDPKTGTTKDHTSLYRHSYSSDPSVPEPLWSYAIIGVLRTDLFEMYHVAKHPFVWKHAEIAACLAPFIITYLHGGTSLLAAYTSVWYSGQVVAYAENYLEHYGATPGHRQTDSVSCYNKLYNYVWFNNGYHQEHHFAPTVHWSKTPTVREQLKGNDKNRRVIPMAHAFNMLYPLEYDWVKAENNNKGGAKTQ